MPVLHPYLNFNGNTEEAFEFYRSVFGGEFNAIMRFKDVPAEYNLNENELDKIMHISLPIGKDTLLMGSDVPEHFGHAIMGTNFYVSVAASSEEEADRLFKGLSAGGHVAMSLERSFWGSYFGMFRDKFGIQWMINYEYGQK